jgi:hypothetical protein
MRTCRLRLIDHAAFGIDCGIHPRSLTAQNTQRVTTRPTNPTNDESERDLFAVKLITFANDPRVMSLSATCSRSNSSPSLTTRE